MISDHGNVLLDILKLRNTGENHHIDTGETDWVSVLKLAEMHRLLPLVFDTAVNCRLLKNIDKNVRSDYQEKALKEIIKQVISTNSFLNLIEEMQKNGLNPVVVKGIVCRQLYQQPFLRPSVDEDLLVDPGELNDYKTFLLNHGYTALDDDTVDSHEYGFVNYDSLSYVEIHTSLFDHTEPLYRKMNQFFSCERTGSLNVDDLTIRTLSPSEHLLFLILHAFKHFLHSGFGIRQVMDIALYGKHYNSEIDWDYIENCCKEVDCYYLAGMLFRIAVNHLGFDYNSFSFSDYWKEMEGSEMNLLMDLLESGIDGAHDIDRLHSSTMTVNAVSDQNKPGLMKSLFPEYESMAAKYSYLRNRKYLLPIAWSQRILTYLFSEEKSNPSKSIKIGKQRIELLREYRVIGMK